MLAIYCQKKANCVMLHYARKAIYIDVNKKIKWKDNQDK